VYAKCPERASARTNDVDACTAAKLPEAVTAVCVFASIGPYGMPGLDFADGLGGDDFREEIRRMLEEPGRAREDFRAQSAVTLAQRGSPDWWLEKWGDRAGQDSQALSFVHPGARDRDRRLGSVCRPAKCLVPLPST
jgi:hypothetical protein